MNSDMTSNQPYLLRAFYDWILDNGLTPYVVVSTQWPEVEVPQQFVKDNQIVLNISPNACVNFHMDVKEISFQARFSGQPMVVRFPCLAVGAIYAKENGAGTVFTMETPDPTDESSQHLSTSESSDGLDKATKPSSKTTKKATLRVVK